MVLPDSTPSNVEIKNKSNKVIDTIILELKEITLDGEEEGGQESFPI
jgi:hypothetical protein